MRANLASAMAARNALSGPNWPARVAWGLSATSLALAIAVTVLYFVNSSAHRSDTPGDPISAFGALIFSS